METDRITTDTEYVQTATDRCTTDTDLVSTDTDLVETATDRISTDTDRGTTATDFCAWIEFLAEKLEERWFGHANHWAFVVLGDDRRVLAALGGRGHGVGGRE